MAIDKAMLAQALRDADDAARARTKGTPESLWRDGPHGHALMWAQKILTA